jgi:hypothetical protein
MFRSLVRPTVVGRPGKIRWIAVGVIAVGALVSGPVQAAAQDAAAPAAQAAAPPNPFMFMSDGSLLINYVKPDKTADFEMVMGKVKEALAKSEKPERKAQAEGWKIFKTDLKGPENAITYFAIVDPVIKGNDYNMRTILTEAFGVADTNTIYKTLADSVAGQQLVAMTLAVSMK